MPLLLWAHRRNRYFDLVQYPKDLEYLLERCLIGKTCLLVAMSSHMVEFAACVYFDPYAVASSAVVAAAASFAAHAHYYASPYSAETAWGPSGAFSGSDDASASERRSQNDRLTKTTYTASYPRMWWGHIASHYGLS